MTLADAEHLTRLAWEAGYETWAADRRAAGLPAGQRDYLLEQTAAHPAEPAPRAEASLAPPPTPGPAPWAHVAPLLMPEYRQLAARWAELPDRPASGQTEEDLERRTDGIVWLLGWLDGHPRASLAQYRAEVRRTQVEGPDFPGEVMTW